MGTRNVYKLLSIAAVVVVLLAAFGLGDPAPQPDNGNTVYSLRAPSFLTVARADDQAILSVIGDEAGIAAYFKSTSLPDMDEVEAVFRTIEAQTADYILGSVAVGLYPESEDVHVYIHRDGWFLAYYLAADPAGKIFDWRAYRASLETILTTKLENTLSYVAGTALVAYSGCTYYDFRNPDATHLMLIGEWEYSAEDSFELNVPATFAFYERSWSVGAVDRATLKLDGVTISSIDPVSWGTAQGILSAAQLPSGVFHTIVVSGYNYGYGGIALIYRVL